MDRNPASACSIHLLSPATGAVHVMTALRGNKEHGRRLVNRGAGGRCWILESGDLSRSSCRGHFDKLTTTRPNGSPDPGAHWG